MPLNYSDFWHTSNILEGKTHKNFLKQSKKTQNNLNKFTNHKSRHSREGGNPLQINSLVQAMDARLLGHDNIEVF